MPGQNNFPENEEFDNSNSRCPDELLNTRVPCDIRDLTIKDIKSGKSINCTKRSQGNPIPEDVSQRYHSLLNSYDTVLELLSDYDSTRQPAEKLATLTISASPLGTCPQGKHVAIVMRPKSAQDSADSYKWMNQTVSGVEVKARSAAGDFGGPGTWIAPFWFFADDDIKDIEVTAEACGVRASGTPVRKFSSLVRVYRNDVYTLTFKVPSFKEFSREVAASKDVSGSVVNKSSKTTKTYGEETSGTAHTTTRSDNAYHEKSQWSGTDSKDILHKQTVGYGIKDGQYEETHEASRTQRGQLNRAIQDGRTARHKHSTKDGDEFIFDIEEQRLKPTISLKRNSIETDFTKSINDLINFQRRLLKAFNDIQGWIPKVGWKFTANMSIMIGEISGSWGNRYPPNPVKYDRLVYVDPFFDLNFDIKLIEYKLFLMFGIDFSTPEVLRWLGADIQVILKAQGDIKGVLAVNETLKSGEFTPVQLKTDSTVDIYVHGKIQVNDIVYEGKGGVTGGIQFEGDLKAGFNTVPHVDGEFYFIETYAYVKLIDEVYGRNDEFKRKVFSKKTIWKGKLPDIKTN